MNNLTRQEIANLVGLHGGEESVRALLERTGFEVGQVKYPDFTGGQTEASVNKLDGLDNVSALLHGDKEVELRDVIRKFFNRKGDFIPDRLEKAHTNLDEDFRSQKPDKFDFQVTLERIQHARQSDEPFITTTEFERRVGVIMMKLDADERVANIRRGVNLPFCWPQTRIGDYGQTFESKLIPALIRSYQRQYPDREFTNHRQGNLANQIHVVEGTHHDQFVHAINHDVVVGVYFVPFQGLSMLGQREAISLLPDNLLLAGPMDTAISLICWPDILARDYHTPDLDCSAVYWQSSADSLRFGAVGTGLYFARTDDLAAAYGDYSGGVVCLG